MIKKIGKKIVYSTKDRLWKIYLKYYFNKQIKVDFLTKSDYLDDKFEKAINKYWTKYQIKINKHWHKWYSSRNGIIDVKYIPEDLFYSRILPLLNKIELKKAYCDKGLLRSIFPEVKQAKNIVNNFSGTFYDEEMNIISIEDALKKCSFSNKLFIKPSIDSGGGRGIEIIETDNKDGTRAKVLASIKNYKKDFVIQEEIKQHKLLDEINTTSINTIRPISYFDGKNVHILSSILRMGINGAKVDSESSGGISCGINKNGILREHAFDRYGNIFDKHPQGYVFKDSRIPSYFEIEKIIKKEHKRFGHFKLISWDFAVDHLGHPILIEYNLGMQGINFHQMNNGPLFGEHTDDILQMLKKD